MRKAIPGDEATATSVVALAKPARPHFLSVLFCRSRIHAFLLPSYLRIPITLLSAHGTGLEFMDTPRPSDDEIAAASRELDGRTPQEILAWAVRRFHPRLMMATAFGAEGCCIIHMLAEIEPGVRVINLDTGYQFPETLELRERIQRALRHRRSSTIRPELTVAEYEAEHGGPLYVHRPDQCCHDRKILPLRRAVERVRRLDQRHPQGPDRRTGRRPAWCSGTRSSTW